MVTKNPTSVGLFYALFLSIETHPLTQAVLNHVAPSYIAGMQGDVPL